MLQQHLHRAALEAGQALAVSLRVLAEEVLREQRRVFAAIAERGDADLDRVEPEEQVLAEPARGHFIIQVRVGRRDDADVDAPRA